MNRARIGHLDHAGQYVATACGESDPIPPFIKEGTCSYITEAVRNGKDPHEVIRMMLDVAALAMRHGIFPNMTKQIIGEPVGDQQCFTF